MPAARSRRCSSSSAPNRAHAVSQPSQSESAEAAAAAEASSSSNAPPGRPAAGAGSSVVANSSEADARYAFEFVVSGTGPRAYLRQEARGRSLLCGRFGYCDCVMGHEEREGIIGENLLIGRVQVSKPLESRRPARPFPMANL